MARVVAAAVYGILVGGDVEALRACGLESGDRLAGATPHRARPALEVRDLEAAAGSGRTDGLDRLADRLEQAVALVSHMRGVQAAVPGRGRDQRRDLVGRRVHPRRVDEPGRQAERARVHRGVDRGDHRGQLVRGGRPRVGAQHGPANRPVADQEGDVRAERLLGDPIEVLAEARPAGLELVRAQRQVDQLTPGVGDRREAVAAVARQLGRVALVEVAGQRAIEEQRSVRVPVRVDEPRRHDHPAEIEDQLDPAGIHRGQVADREDPVAEHADIGTNARRPAPVDDGPTPEQQVECGHPPMVPRSTSAKLRIPWGYSSAGRAPAWHAGGPGFESP